MVSILTLDGGGSIAPSHPEDDLLLDRTLFWWAQQPMILQDQSTIELKRDKQFINMGVKHYSESISSFYCYYRAPVAIQFSTVMIILINKQ